MNFLGGGPIVGAVAAARAGPGGASSVAGVGTFPDLASIAGLANMSGVGSLDSLVKGKDLPQAPPGLPEALLHYTFPSEADTLAYVDALKHSDISQWRSLQEVAARAGGGSCSGAVNTSVLTALYLLGLFNLCAASPVSCCVPPANSRRRRRRRNTEVTEPELPPLLNNLQYNLSSLSLEQFPDLPHVTTADGGRIPVHISVVEQVRKLWDSNPRLLSSVTCSSPTEAVRSSFISLSGVASGIILAYSWTQLTQCYPDHNPDPMPITPSPKIWFFPLPKLPPMPAQFPVPSIPGIIPVPGDDEEPDGCERDEVPLETGKCAPLLNSAHCPLNHWLLRNPKTKMGECVPRLCPEEHVYVEADQMCHDINEEGICPSTQRLFLKADGHAVCDCPDGMFQGPYGNCHFLYEPSYCYKGMVLQFDRPSKTLICKPDPCGAVNTNLWPDDLPFAPLDEDGYCYQFNEQGPCEKGERFGYDIDELEAACISLEEAGLLRPRRSYQYQRLSIPATDDKPYRHYQLSYLIMNGTTWGLEVKGITPRGKRDISERESNSTAEETIIPFLDTREIPEELTPLFSAKRPKWVIDRTAHQTQTHEQNQKYEKISVNGPKLKRSEKNENKESISSSASSSKNMNIADEKRKFKLNQNAKIQTSPKKNRFIYGRRNFHNRDRIKTSNNFNKKLKRPRTSHLTQRYGIPYERIRPASYFDRGRSKNRQKRKHHRRHTSLISDLDKSFTNSSTNDLVESSVEDIISKAINISKHAEIEVQRNISKSTGEQDIKINEENSEEQNHFKEDEVKVEKVKNRKTNQKGKDKNDNVKQNEKKKKNVKADKEDDDEVSIVRVNQESMLTNNNNNDIAKKVIHNDLDPHNPMDIVKVKQDSKLEVAKISKEIYKRKKDKGNGKPNRKRKNKKSKRRRKRKRKKKKKKNPSLPFRVPTVLPPTEENNATSDTNSTSNLDTENENDENFNNTNNATDNINSNVEEKIDKDKQHKITKKDKLISSSIEDSELETNPSSSFATSPSSSEASLPDYMCHRGRRQLGSGGGIIQAPLLTACKPGAKRDYNYKCRPKFIPQERNKRSDDDKATSIPPKIKCPEGTRLDPRGQCQTTTSALG
ncbi:unnamed protein product [Meganyctiphanes norvegica]|uniref:DUF4789 domain-containing protein n=1 Tax=Meganyctiphanes norvegica TaxID=48144 RepID=A0AAV2QUL8_MEGNR